MDISKHIKNNINYNINYKRSKKGLYLKSSYQFLALYTHIYAYFDTLVLILKCGYATNSGRSSL